MHDRFLDTLVLPITTLFKTAFGGGDDDSNQPSKALPVGAQQRELDIDGARILGGSVGQGAPMPRAMPEWTRANDLR